MASIINYSKQEKEKEVFIQSDKYQNYVNFAKFYALPIVSVLVFLGIVIFTIIPNIRYMFDTFDEIDQLKIEDEALDARIDKLENLKTENEQRKLVLDTINFLVPTGKSEVVKFRERVTGIAVNQSLDPQSSKSGENIIDSEEATVSSIEGFKLIQIPSEFRITGGFNNFRNYLNKLYEGQDFFIVDEMSLSSSSAEENVDSWGGDFNLTKYQFFTDEEFIPSTFFASISENESPNQAVIEFIETKFLDEVSLEEVTE